MVKQGQLTPEEAEPVFWRVNDRYQLDVLTKAEREALRELRDQLTDLISPYTIEELDKEIEALNAKFPDWEHFYHRIGKTVTWYDRPRSPEHPLWQLFPH
jgi:polyhydroxyalkanoate synthesis regulator phasin